MGCGGSCGCGPCREKRAGGGKAFPNSMKSRVYDPGKPIRSRRYQPSPPLRSKQYDPGKQVRSRGHQQPAPMESRTPPPAPDSTLALRQTAAVETHSAEAPLQSATLRPQSLSVVAAPTRRDVWPGGKIQDAIDVAANGDTIIVHAGLYKGKGNHDIDFRGLRITVRSEKSEGGRDAVIIDLENENRGFIFRGKELRPSLAPSGEFGTTLNGVTIRNGRASSGGGILCHGNPKAETIDDIRGSPLIEDCVIIDCEAKGSGGGICCTGHSVPEIKDCLIVHNGAGGFGGGVAIEGPFVGGTVYGSGSLKGKEPGLVIRGCTIGATDPQAPVDRERVANSAGRDGGGLWVNDRMSPSILGCTIAGNVSGRHGGGVALDNGSGGQWVDCTVSTNIADKDGGGMWCDEQGVPKCSDCLFRGNFAGRNGGGVWIRNSSVGLTDPRTVATPWGSPPQFTRCSIVDNRATVGPGVGGGLYVEGPPNAQAAGVFFNHGFIVGNSADSGGGAYVKDGGLYLNNSVLNDNNATNLSLKGGLGGGAAVVGLGSMLKLWFCTAFANLAAKSGCTVYIDGGTPVGKSAGQLTIDSSILWEKDPPPTPTTVLDSVGRSLASPGAVSVLDSVVRYGVSGRLTRSAFMETFNPQFLPASQQPGGVTYVLSDGSADWPVSPCKNKAGRSAPYVSTKNIRFLPWTVDIRGASRMVGVAPDIGAYEIQEP